MQNAQTLNWNEIPVDAAPPRLRASRHAKWVFGLGLASATYAYALFLYLSNPVIQHWVSAHWPAVNLPGVFLIIMAAGLGLSLPACVLGWKELAAIRRGEIPRARRTIVWVGIVLAFVSSALFYVGLVALRFVKAYALGVVERPFGR